MNTRKKICSDPKLDKTEVFNSNKANHCRSDEIFQKKKSVRFNDNIEVHFILIDNNKKMKSLKEYAKH